MTAAAESTLCRSAIAGSIAIDREEVLHDVANLAYVVADVREGEYSAHSLHHTFDVCAPGNIERSNRILDLAIAEAENMLRIAEASYPHRPGGPFCRIVSSFRQLSNEDIIYLRHLVHEYLVTKVFTDWLEIAFPPLIAASASGGGAIKTGADNILSIWREKCESAKSSLLSARASLSIRCTPRRLPPI